MVISRERPPVDPIRQLRITVTGDGEAEVVAGLDAQLLPERGQGLRGGGAGAALDEGPAAVMFEPGDLGVEEAWREAERLGGIVDAGVPGDYQQAQQALSRVAAGEGMAERFGQVPRVLAGCR